MSHKSYFCIMDNVFCTKRKIDYRFDLKGSTFGRRTIVDGKFDQTVALKDLDFIDRGESFKVGENNKRKLMEIIKKDVQFFQEN